MNSPNNQNIFNELTTNFYSVLWPEGYCIPEDISMVSHISCTKLTSKCYLGLYEKHSNTVSIVDSEVRYYPNLSQDTWAFIIGHEIGHAVIDCSGISTNNKELLADLIAYDLIKFSGYSTNNALLELSRHYKDDVKICENEHGCWNGRVEKIINIYGLDDLEESLEKN